MENPMNNHHFPMVFLWFSLWINVFYIGKISVELKITIRIPWLPCLAMVNQQFANWKIAIYSWFTH